MSKSGFSTSTQVPGKLGQRFVGGTRAAIWHKSLPAKLRGQLTDDDPTAAFAAWQNHLAKRKQPEPLERLLPEGRDALLWGLGRDDSAGLPEPLGQRSASSTGQQRVLAWLSASTSAAPSTAYAVETIAWAWQLPALAGCVDAPTWWAVLEHLLNTADEADAIDPQTQPLLHQLLAGELPLTLAYLLPELTPARRLVRDARKTISRGLVDLLDGEGLPHAVNLPLLRPLLACWTRCSMMAECVEGGGLASAARTQYEWLVRQAIRFARHDGSAMFPPPPGGQPDLGLLRAAIALGGDEEDKLIATLALPGSDKQSRKRADKFALPEPSLHGEWAEVAMLRPDWSRTATRLGVTYPGDRVDLELIVGRDVLIAGQWEARVFLDGRRIEPEGEWEEICWVTDDEIDYLELEIDYAEGVRLQRQLAMARDDGFLLAADCVLAPEGAKLAYQATMPLAAGARFEPERDSHEGWLGGENRRALVMPLALPEWRALSGPGELQKIENRIHLSMQTDAHRLYAPLWFDLDRRRAARRFTWRRLTVAEQLEVLPRDVCAGYRVASGNEQWLVYRSLAPVGNRTLLGHNLVSETLVARFDNNGEVETLVEVD